MGSPGMTAFYTYHAAYAEDDSILSADSRYDDFDDVVRVPLEPDEDGA